MRIETGFPEDQRDRVAYLFWEAFSGKLGRVLAPERKALAFIEHALDPSHALSALSEQGELLGIAGFKTYRGGLLTAGFQDMARVYGLLGAAWRGSLLDMLERPISEKQMLLDGLFVAAEARGQGVGSSLIDAVVAQARWNDMAEIRLDVIDANIRARALYERYGFSPTERIELGWLSRIFGFHHATTMCLTLR
ncbi:GNAT family N-acetyltransferase [Aliiruegeria lutimaris]|uniref:Acetyltransferase (GNAT) family protein n=1 Tax=Aliiruegeria lutimaris TaxID=571298 RepID=A0A1G8P516_9RHOB|nr:GNAT family N-acetyltransferase [Aliiruegeria lutimaris]SDI87396.1 Acetyltransferase (GNAT) family protein [Aliiruegeria lutimaris]